MADLWKYSKPQNTYDINLNIPRELPQDRKQQLNDQYMTSTDFLGEMSCPTQYFMQTEAFNITTLGRIYHIILPKR